MLRVNILIMNENIISYNKAKLYEKSVIHTKY
jgi:hypothetical protein